MNDKTYEIVGIVRQLEENEARLEEIYDYHKKHDKTTEALQDEIKSLRLACYGLEDSLYELENN